MCSKPLALMLPLLLTSALLALTPAGRAQAEASASSWDIPRLVQAALSVSPELVQKRLELESAAARQREARAARLPKATFQIQASKLTPYIDAIVLRPGSTGSISLPDTSGLGGVNNGYIPPANVELFEGMPDQMLSTFVQVEQPVYTSGKISLAIHLADLNHELESYRLEEKGFETAYIVHKLGLGLYLGEASLAQLTSMITELGQILADTRAILARGLVTEADVLGVEAQLRSLEEEQAKGRAELVRLRETLRMLTGALPEDPLILEGRLESLPVPEVPPLEALLEEATARRPELKSLASQVELARAQVRFVATDLPFHPTLGMRLEGGFRGDRVPILQTNWSKTWDSYYQASLALQVKLMDGGAAASKVRQSSLQARQAELGEAQTRILIVAQVREQHARLEAALRGLARADAEEKAARERRRQAEQGSQRGTIGRSEFLKGHLEWARATTGRIVALFNLQVARLELDHATGRLPRSASEAAQALTGPQALPGSQPKPTPQGAP